MTTIYLIRHGQASFGADDYDQLSHTGIQQARVLGEALSGRLAPDAQVVAFAGSMRRHTQTAEGCLAALRPAHGAQVHAGLDEFDHEDVIACHEPKYRDRSVLPREMKEQADPMAAFQHMFEVAMARWLQGSHDNDYIESWPAFRARCSAAFDEVVQRTPRGATALVFTSGGTIGVLLQRLMGLDIEAMLRLNWRMANASLTKLTVAAGGPRVLSVNEHAHLEVGGGRLLTFR